MEYQSQKSGSSSTNIQGKEVNVKIGLSYDEVKSIALDIFESNFIKLSNVAKVTATERAQEITEKFLRKLMQENPKGFQLSKDPDFQSALFDAQKAYAKIGDIELGDLLIDILIDRSKFENRDLIQIVLTESLSVAPKLTPYQINTLSVIFYLRLTQNQSLGSHELYVSHLKKFITPILDKLAIKTSDFQHIEFSGCGSVSIGSTSLEKIILMTYPGLFQKGFSEEEIPQIEISISTNNKYVIPCFNNPDKLQFRANTAEILRTNLSTESLSGESIEKLIKLFETKLMNEKETKDKCLVLDPIFNDVFQIWNDTSMKHVNLTSVGIAIAHANLQRIHGFFSDLRNWI